MKNLKLFKRGVSLFTVGALTMSLVSACGKDNKGDDNDNDNDKDFCHHFVVRVGDEYEVYKECEGYDLDITVGGNTGTCYFEISRNDKLLLEGTTMEYTQFNVDHDSYVDENIAFQKVKGK